MYKHHSVCRKVGLSSCIYMYLIINIMFCGCTYHVVQCITCILLSHTSFELDLHKNCSVNLPLPMSFLVERSSCKWCYKGDIFQSFMSILCCQLLISDIVICLDWDHGSSWQTCHIPLFPRRPCGCCCGLCIREEVRRSRHQIHRQKRSAGDL